MTNNGNILTSVAAVRRALRKVASPYRARVSRSFFKTAPGQYAAGDLFLGIAVPDIRLVVRRAQDLPSAGLVVLLRSKWHEERLAALLILVRRYQQSKSAAERMRIYRFYVRHLACVDNWDLVDTSAPQIIGQQLLQGDRRQLYKWASAKSMWPRRIAVVATLTFIRAGDFSDTLRLAKLYRSDSEDLMHKATGWMLREVGKKNLRILEVFLRRHAHEMPRTMLRYAIEKMPASKRRYYLQMDRAVK